MTELCEYAANVDVSIARESIRAVGKIALQQYDVNAIVDRLLQFLEMEKDYVTAETLVNSRCHYFVVTCNAPNYCVLRSACSSLLFKIAYVIVSYFDVGACERLVT